LVAENFVASGESSNFEVRPVLIGALAVNPTPWLALEGNITAMPAGLPMAGGEFTGVSGFDLYTPGGVIDSLRKDFVAFGSLRLIFHGHF
jgi:hypothetical protein